MYEVKVKSKEEMNQLSTKMTTTFSNSAVFTTEMQKTMEANDVKSVSPSSITADTTAVPKSAGNVGSADGDNISNETDGADAGGAIAGAIVGVLVLGGIAVGGFLWYRNKQKQDDQHNAPATPAIGTLEMEMTYITNPTRNKQNQDDQHNAPATPATPAMKIFTDEVDDIQHFTDPATGKRYSHNFKTGETKWL